MTLYLLKYNNYYNRIVKYENDLNGYLAVNENSEYLYQLGMPLTKINFNPNDGVLTSQVINWNNEIPDYVLVTSDDPTDTNIYSRWFVIEAVRERKNQYTLSLKRDLVVDFLNTSLNSPAFIEKATLNIENKLIFNKENGMSYNQIKKNEHLLKDESGCGWLVGYVSPNDIGSITVSIPESGTNYPGPGIDYNTLKSYADKGNVYTDTGVYSLQYRGTLASGTSNNSWAKTALITLSCWAEGDTTVSSIESSSEAYRSDILWHYPKGTLESAGNNILNLFRQQREAYTSGISTLMEQNITDAKKIDKTTYETLLNMNGITYSDGTRIFTVNVNNIQTYQIFGAYQLTNSSGAAYVVAKSVLDSSGAAEYSAYLPKDSGTGLWATASYNKISISLTETPFPATSVTITNSVKLLKDQPYRMFAIPVGSKNTVYYDETWKTFSPNADLGKLLATKIATLLGGTGQSFIYDLQYLPYCPVRGAFNYSEQITLWGQDGIDYNLVKDSNGNPLQYLIWADESSFSFNINYPISVPKNSIDFKIDNETKFVRITSPNYNGSYEFKPTMNNGISGFEVYCTYKPFQPYIFVSPIYNDGSLYGGDFNDQRGLVCSGDFSVTILNDNWIDYQIQNKSYADAFDRQIDNMSITYSIQREQQRRSGYLSAISTAIGASTSGGLIGGSLGGVAGGIAGGALGIAGGIAGGALSIYGLKEDLKYSDALHNEALSLAQDNFGYQMQNIQALPYTLGKVSAFSINNKIFPFLEFYDCSDNEKEALRMKLIYNGMTVMSIGKISDYIADKTSFIQAQIIQFDNINDDYHIAAELASEIHKGIYININGTYNLFEKGVI